jgi:hypothetical protein
MRPYREVLGSDWPFSYVAGVPLEPLSVVDTVKLDTSTDPELPQSFQCLLVQAGGSQPLPIECQLQSSLLAQKQHLAGRA